ncbi:hypothetical protein A9Q02_09340 [Candidatus Chloroploca asiatica]|uniref:DEAD/DEAH box helicase n=1 Tax=Candidatus Chloroploca asiatica TaxID=1506545 RepID=A0A2H3L262_9CHLR|nr:hypothetical protein A9Q02_09340 [Candidatus Chloroploca asiatica]
MTQLAAIPYVLDGAQVVLMAPTASGKTEAIAAPVSQLHRNEGWEELAVIYVVPTRALANDTLVRVGGPVSDMGFRIELKHGDRPYLPQALDWLITTPESLDSLLSRRPQMLKSVRAIILDEIHLLDNTYRGDQLRILVTRLQALTATQLKIHLISATLADPDAVAARYVTSATVVAIDGQRSASLQFAANHTDIKLLARTKGWKKLLYFCNKREGVELVARDLAEIWQPYPVVAHHGSLSRQRREEAEQVLREARVAVGVATSTLEVGIDIGDIDAVVLADIPWSCSALLQRIGRGNRRSGKIEVVGISTDIATQRVLSAMFDMVTGGYLDPSPYILDRSVVVQQIFSILFQQQGSGSDEHELAALLHHLALPSEVKAILNHLATRDWLEQKSNKWFLSTTMLDKAERGEIHSNIPDSAMYQVIDVESNQQVGSVAGVVDQVFLLAGVIWEILDVHYPVMRVRRYRGSADPAVFKRHPQAGRYTSFLPVHLRR